MGAIKPQENQNILDISLQEYGSIEGLFQLMDDNQIHTGHQELSVYEDVVVKSPPVKKDIVEFYVSRNIKPATGVTDKEIDLFKDKRNCEGIGCMEIEYDFIVYKDPEAEPKTCLEQILYPKPQR